MWVSLKRVLKSGTLSFWRNRWVSSATIGVMVITLALITSLIVMSAITGAVLDDLEEKVDITVYFNLDTPEKDILQVKEELEAFPEVKVVEYVSREEALAKFSETHRENPLITQSLEELGDNPLEASLNIKARVISEYESIASFLEGRRFSSIIDTVNYRENQKVIERLSSIINIVRKTGFLLSIILAVVAVLVAFNTIRLTIYSLREEIGVMRLVGASNWYIRGPFVIEGVIYGVIASIISIIILAIGINLVSGKLVGFLPGITLSGYFFGNFWEILLIQTAIGVVLGTISSLIAVRRYLRI